MARFKIYSKDGQSVRYEGKPKYLGVYLNPSCLKFSEISSSEPIAWEVGDYVDYPRTGMRYRLYSIPQPSKEARRGSYGGAFRYSGVELYAATKELEIALFRDLVGNDNNIHFSTSPDVTTFENVYGIARRIQASMDDLYPGRWEIRVADFNESEDAEIIEKISEAKDFALSGGTCLDALSKIYELWRDIGWIHSYENGKEVITIGYANKRIDANTTDSYLYGKGNGLTAIKKTQTNGEEFATRLYVYGSERNLPPRYYNGLDILNAESVDIRNLMLPPGTWGKTDDLPDARKAYLENAEAVAKFGVIPKTHYFDSTDAGADIYPTIEGLTIGEIRNAMSPDDDYYPSESYADTDRADAVLSAENPSDDGVINPNGKEYDAKEYLSIQSVDETVNMVGGVKESPLLTDYLLFSKTIETDFSRGKVVVDLSQTIAIPDKGFSSVVARVTIGDDEQAGYGTTVGSNAFPAVKSEDGKNWEIKLGRISAEYGKSELYDNTEYNVYGHVSITANTVGVESSEITIVFRPGSGSIGIKRILDKTFRLNLKQIGFDINEQASLGKGKTISMKTGACAGRNFVISDCFYSSAYNSWVLTCKRQQDDTLGMLFPNNAYAITGGDIFVLVDIAMPSLYISVAMNRLLSEGQKFLARASKIQSHYEPSIDAKVMAESGRTLREGMFMEITDEDVVDNTTDYILIDTLSISEDESTIPTYKVTLRERRKVTYKGTPSVTSSTETKPVEDETEVQPNVDLTGYAKETYVNDKVSEVNNLLASMWTIDEETGDLVTDRNVRIAKNVIIGGDTSTGGTGQDVPSGIDEAQLKEYLDTNKYITSDYAYSKEEVNRLIDEVNAGDIDLTNYYTKEETASEISNAIAGIEIPSLDGYATEQFVTDSITALNVGQYATKTALETLQGEVDNIEAVLGMDEEAEGIINTWNEVKAFLDGYSSSDDLAAILSGMNADIATRALGSDLDALAVRVGVNESAIEDNATNIRNAKGEIDGLKDTKADWGTTLAHYGITDAYTKTEVANELAKYLLLESANQTIKGNITIEGNLVVKGDTSSTARGTDSGTDGTLIGVIVNGTRYEDETNGMLDLSTLMNQYALATAIPSLDGYAKLTDIPATMAWTAITGKPSFASVATSGSYNDLSNKPTIPTKTSQIAEETNLYFTNARAVSALADTLKDYVTKTALASDLGEYASKEWVNEKGYITGITLTGDDYISVNGYRLSLAIDAQGGLTNTGQGLGIYQIPSAKIVTDALGYTPLSTSGGTISGILTLNSGNRFSDVSKFGLEMNNSDIGKVNAIYFSDQSNSSSEGIHFGRTNGNWDTIHAYEGELYFTTNRGSSESHVGNTLIHSGNIGSQSVNKANSLVYYSITDVNDAASGRLFYGKNASNTPATSYVAGLTIPQGDLGYKYQLAFDFNGNLYSRKYGGSWLDWKTIAFTEFTNAQELEWKDTSGTARNVLFLDGYNDLVLGRETSIAGYRTRIQGNSVELRYSTSQSVGLILNSSGNVTIGASDLAGTSAKLYVDGVAAAPLLRFVNNDGTTGSYIGRASTGHDNILLYIPTANDFYIATNGTERMRVTSGGNVLIGTTADSGYKLDVNGDAIRVGNNDSCFELSHGWGLAYRYKGSGGWNRGMSFVINDSVFAAFGAYSGVGAYIGTGYTDRWFDINSSIARFYGAVTMSSGLTVSGSTTLSSATIDGGLELKHATPFIDFHFGKSSADYTSRLIEVASGTLRAMANFQVTGSLTVDGNAVFKSDTSTGSDIRFKDKITDHRIALSDIAEAPLFTFKWNDREDKATHLGTSAQYWEGVAPWLVRGEDFKTLDYSTLGVAIGISLANKTLNHEERIKILEKENKALKEEIRRIQYGN